MIAIKPALISADFNEVSQKLADLETLCSEAHIDVSDGLFSPLVTRYTPDDLYDIPGRLKLEAHLMIEEPEDVLPAWAGVVDRLIVQAEAAKDLGVIIDSLKPHYTKVGVSLLLNTRVEEIELYLDQLDLIQLMAIENIGKQGEKLDEIIYAKTKYLSGKFDGIIQIDGGVTKANAPILVEHGANSLVVGSGIWQADDYVKEIEDFMDLF